MRLQQEIQQAVTERTQLSLRLGASAPGGFAPSARTGEAAPKPSADPRPSSVLDRLAAWSSPSSRGHWTKPAPNPAGLAHRSQNGQPRPPMMAGPSKDGGTKRP
ncbi:hypothetical protein BDY21DRAFT_40972 [Lineolata rhizophorae]|uniref:Uncharacterized protein n=1 Tax=Lineolata rhizophorae TaxID=578093 RepID=A0A6A6NYE9_9PEZI|nr:hypothetical protein BDY21DRAFT_40972 [Lineolata rhizophorae]